MLIFANACYIFNKYVARDISREKYNVFLLNLSCRDQLLTPETVTNRETGNEKLRANYYRAYNSSNNNDKQQSLNHRHDIDEIYRARSDVA